MPRAARRWHSTVRRLATFGIAGLGLLASCTDSDSAPSTTIAASFAGDGDAPTDSPGGSSEPAAELCERTGTSAAGDVENPDLDEASGLVASRVHPGVLWSHNDGSDGALFAIGADGRDLGVLEVGADEIDDIEDIALFSRPEGTDILLADIGDNDVDRSAIRIYRFTEPDPASPGPIEDVEVLEYVYPDRPHNAETLLVDEAADTIVIVTKEQVDDDGVQDDLGATAPSFVFEGRLDAASGGPVELRAVGTIDMPALDELAYRSPRHPAGLIGAGGVPTGGDVSADGSLIALRTYETVWLWSRAETQSVAEAVLGEPCEVKGAFERQGEAIAFDSGGLVTLGEGTNQPLHLIAR